MVQKLKYNKIYLEKSHTHPCFSALPSNKLPSNHCYFWSISFQMFAEIQANKNIYYFPLSYALCPASCSFHLTVISPKNLSLSLQLLHT